MRKLLALTLTASFILVASSNAQLTPDQINFAETPSPNGLNLIHCPGCGDLDVWATNGEAITTLEITSKSGSFRGEKTDFGATFGGLFDVYTPDKAFKLEPAGFGLEQISFGNLAGAGNNWTFEQLRDDLVISGSLLKGGDLAAAAGGVWIITPVPEPTCVSLFGMAGLGLLGFRRRR
jgi:hypothetical protein